MAFLLACCKLERRCWYLHSQRAGCSQALGHNAGWGESAVLAKKGHKTEYFSSGALAAGRSPSVPQGECEEQQGIG